MRETSEIATEGPTNARKWDTGLLIAFLDFLCRILDPMTPTFTRPTLQTASNFHNKVVLGLELGEVSYVESGYRALHLSPGLVGSTRKVRVVIHRGRCPGPVEVTLVVSSVRCGVWLHRRWVHLVSSQQMSRYLVKMPWMPQMLRGVGWLSRQRWWVV